MPTPLDAKDYQNAKDAVEKIAQDTFRVETKSEDDLRDIIKITLKNAVNAVDRQYQRTIYNYMGSLLLNVMINRLNELGKNAKQDSITAREMIVELIKEGEIEYV